jgi:tRNA nucleotidyltransferase (CCA-adding enzyme)
MEQEADMKVYLVGGAVRDELLGYPVHERDWVVVGAKPDVLLRQGYQQVGRDFPVFLHPNTHEEYALARTERKQGAGYYGFTCDFNPQVTLEEDLRRRDLTINAMAKDENGRIIDPFNGQADLNQKSLRHVSSAFIEDPVRVLRVARFAARYHHLGFTVAEETRQIMVEMVKRGELLHLVAERVWQEFYRSLSERNPEQFILVLRACGALSIVFPELDALFGIPNPPESYPHIDSGLQALDALKKMTAFSLDPLLRFAALMHNLGHLATPVSQWPHHAPTLAETRVYVQALCHRLRAPSQFTEFAQLTAQFYQPLGQFQQLDAPQCVNYLEQCDAFRKPERFAQLLEVVDVIARPLLTPQAKNWLSILDICGKITAQSAIEQGCQGKDIKQKLHQQRVDAVLSWKNNT